MYVREFFDFFSGLLASFLIFERIITRGLEIAFFCELF